MRVLSRGVRSSTAVVVCGCALLLSGCGNLITGDPEPLNPPTGDVIVSGGGQTCTYTLTVADNGIGDCILTFNVAGTFEIYAEYVGDDEHYGSTSGPESHTVALAQTVTKILSALPSPSVKGDDVVVTVMVTGGSTPPSGAVDVDAGGNRRCTITLSNGLGFCTISFNQAGNYTIRADYTGDSTHDTSWDEVNHQVLNNPLPPTATATNTPIPPTPTAGPSPPPPPTPMSAMRKLSAACWAIFYRISRTNFARRYPPWQPRLSCCSTSCQRSARKS